jgi:two-component system, cell cycle response regulator
VSAEAGTGLVLVADDSLVIRAWLRRELEGHGYQVIEAVDGEEALRTCREKAPDVVLLDVEMPKLDGHAVLAQMKRDVDLAGIPVVFCTGRTTTDDVVEGLRLGAHDYLRKPFEGPEVLARVGAALRVKNLQDQLRMRNAELERMSRNDMLTSLPNRRHLQEHLVAECASSRRHGHPLAVLMVDADQFKSINDTRGHVTGDEVLRALATRLRDACRPEDVAGRWGGEEFLVIAPHTDLDGAVALGEEIRTGVSNDAVAVTDGPPLRVTVSVGAATSAVGDLELLLRNADAALYDAKAAGRDRVRAWSDEGDAD